MDYFSVKNFEQFQHYKDRSPPWIKFYNSVLDDYAFTRLPDAARFHLVAIWLLASRTDNRIPNDPEWVRQAIKANVSVDLCALFDAGFLVEYKRKGCKRRASKVLVQSRAETEHIEQQSRADSPPAAFENGKEKKMPSKEAERIAQRVAALLDGDPGSKNWHGSYVETWLVEGHTEDRIIAAAERVRERGTEVNSITYLHSILVEEFSAPEESTVGVLPPPGMRASKSTAEYLQWGRETYGAKFEHGHIKYSKWQFVPADWSGNVTPLRKASA